MHDADSSEIAKHLRSVHLSLVLACVLVLVLTILRGVSPSTVEKAHKQLQDILTIREDWGFWTREFGQEQLTWLAKNGLIPSDIVPSQVFITPDELGRRNLSTHTQEWSVTPKYVLYFYVTITPPGKDGQEAVLSWAQKTDQGLEVNSEPPPLRSLEEFRNFWNGAGNIGVFNVMEFSPWVYLVSDGGISNRLSWTRTSQASQTTSVDLKPPGLALKAQDKCNPLTGTLLSSKPKFNILFCGRSPVENAQAVLPVRVTWPHVPRNLRLWLSQKFKFHSTGSSFEDTFPELNQVTRLYQQLRLDDVKTIVGDELRRAGERVQFLGLTFPERVVSTWGIVIILIVHLYFWIHLRQLCFRLVPHDPAIKVAWIGFYTDFFGRLGSNLTALILPLGAVLYLAWNQGLYMLWMKGLYLEWDQWFLIMLVGLSLLEFALAVTIFFCSIRL